MDKPKELQELINSVGAMAEMTALYRKGLSEQGIPEKEAIQYTAAFIASVMGGGKGGTD